jgi:hypothetical protein
MVLPIAKNITGSTIADKIVISDFISIAVRIDDDVLKHAIRIFFTSFIYFLLFHR